ncbi:MAG: MSCRAMM family adhesin SdrC [Methanomicrobiales archaeon]|jgi:hypothetical protein|nr:MSCRAMM family adhesin SdrC [Methanomicrobiales archaeon]
MLHKCISGVLFQISLLLLCVSVGAVSLDDFSFQPSTAPQPPLTLIEATINSQGDLLTHDNVYQVHVQVMNTRPHGVDGVVELAAYSISDSAVSLGYETVNLDPDGSTFLSFTFSPNDVVLPCNHYIFVVTTDPDSSTINERDFIYVDERREFTFADCTEHADNGENLSDLSMNTDVSMDMDVSVDTDVNVDTDLNMNIDLSIDTDVNVDTDLSMDTDVSMDTDANVDTDVNVDTDEIISQTTQQNQKAQPMFTLPKTQTPTTQPTQPMFTLQPTKNVD